MHNDLKSLEVCHAKNIRLLALCVKFPAPYSVLSFHLFE